MCELEIMVRIPNVT